jgi:hypothetical protein
MVYKNGQKLDELVCPRTSQLAVSNSPHRAEERDLTFEGRNLWTSTSDSTWWHGLK